MLAPIGVRSMFGDPRPVLVSEEVIQNMLDQSGCLRREGFGMVWGSCFGRYLKLVHVHSFTLSFLPLSRLVGLSLKSFSVLAWLSLRSVVSAGLHARTVCAYCLHSLCVEAPNPFP